MFMELYLMRHGKAQNTSTNISSDSKRKLTESGKKEILNVVKCMERMGIDLDYIASSPLDRAKQTANIVIKNPRYQRPLFIWDELKPETNVANTISKISSIKSRSVLLVGHAPHLVNLISQIISPAPVELNISLKKGGFVHIQYLPNSKIMGTLRSILTPKQLKKICK